MRFDDIVRSERYFTATLLPAILLHDDLGGLDAFLALLDDAARNGQVTEHDRSPEQVLRVGDKPTWSKESVEIITEFHIARDLRYAAVRKHPYAGALNIGATSSAKAEKRSAPDVVIVLDDELVVCEAKFFDAQSVGRLNAQLDLQRRQIGYLLSLRPELRAYRHVVILPVTFDVQPKCDVVLTWAQLADLAARVLGPAHYVTARLRAAITYYDEIFGDRGAVRYFDGVLPLAEMLERCRKERDAISVGHLGGELNLKGRSFEYLDAKPWKWRSSATHVGAKVGKNWIPGGRFVALIEQRRREAEPGTAESLDDVVYIEVPSEEFARNHNVVEAIDMNEDEATDANRRTALHTTPKPPLVDEMSEDASNKRITITESDEMADWNKVPSELIISLHEPGADTVYDLMDWMEKHEMTDTVLYKRMLLDPNFEDKLPSFDDEAEG